MTFYVISGSFAPFCGTPTSVIETKRRKPARSSLCYVLILSYKTSPCPLLLSTISRRRVLVSIRLRNILNTYVLYILKTTILRFAIVRKSDRYTNSLCPLYFTSTLNQRLIAVLCLKSYTKLCDLYSYNHALSVYFW